MNLYLKRILMFVGLIFTSAYSYAGPYEEPGYINWVKADKVGSTCTLELRYDINKNSGTQKGMWSCDNVVGSNMMNLAKTALILNSKVTILFEGDGSTIKPIYDIKLQ